jgi:hypothetical protein
MEVRQPVSPLTRQPVKKNKAVPEAFFGSSSLRADG